MLSIKSPKIEKSACYPLKENYGIKKYSALPKTLRLLSQMAQILMG